MDCDGVATPARSPRAPPLLRQSRGLPHRLDWPVLPSGSRGSLRWPVLPGPSDRAAAVTPPQPPSNTPRWFLDGRRFPVGIRRSEPQCYRLLFLFFTQDIAHIDGG